MKNLEIIAIDLLDMGITSKEDITQVVSLTDQEIEKIIDIIRSK